MVAFEQADGFGIVTLHGELDMANIAPVEEALALALGSGVAIVSLLDVAYLDSSALSALVRQQNASNGRLIVLVATGAPIERIFTITGLREHLRIVATMPEAIFAAQQLRGVPAASFSRDGVAAEHPIEAAEA